LAFAISDGGGGGWFSGGFGFGFHGIIDRWGWYDL
jgi:hypothetical protein